MSVIGYSKIGRSWNLDPNNWSTLGGDVDVWRTLYHLAVRNPQHTFVLVGRNTGENPQECGMPPNVTNPWTELQPILRERFSNAGINHPVLSIPECRTAARILYDLSHQMFRDCDQHVVWTGQHGTSGVPLVFVGEPLDSNKITHPQDSTIYYSSYVIHGINAWRDEDPENREETWLLPDVRNYLKMRDLRWPLRRSVMAQFNETRASKHERFTYADDPRRAMYNGVVSSVEAGHVWVAKTRYTYDALEITALPYPPTVELDYDSPRQPFGMIVNENRKEVTRDRLTVMENWVLPLFPDAEIWGNWSRGSQEQLGRVIEVCPYSKMYETISRYRCTLTTPASGSGWATSKFWESALAGTVCFIHPHYDTQGNIVPLRPVTGDDDLDTLSRWLRPHTPDELKRAVDAVSSDYDLWRYLAETQRRLVERRYRERRAIKEIERRWVTSPGS